MDTAALHGPAFNHLPPWVKAKLSPLAIGKIEAVYEWVENECIPREEIFKAQLEGRRWTTPRLIHELRDKAKERGLFNLFLPNHFKESPGLTNLEYSCCAEIMGRCYWAAQTMNCHAPETGNIELLAKYCTEEQKNKWLQPLLDGTASSAYSMTEPDVASSDATQIGIRIKRDGDSYVINGRKLYGNCLWNKELSFYILMGCTDPENPNKWSRHSMIIVPCNTPGITQVRNLTIMGYDHAPEGHGEYLYENVRVPAENVILGEGRAFEIAQGRLGPGRIHHCMRLIGQCERAYELALIRCNDARKRPRGKLIGEFDSNIERVAQMRLELDAARLVVLNAADTMDLLGNKAGKRAIAQSKILVPIMATKIIDECMQMFGGQGLTQHTPLPEMWTYARFVRVADGPDAAHRHQVGREEMKKAAEVAKRHQSYTERYKEFADMYGEKFITYN
ncbi:Acyl-CoA dehydrogenase family member 10 [Colletotrichum fructicola Nara gc5]|uniref:Acyl-CoA dehydrogenase n=1 Tax=Colletotrichum fructicola (strain Nara gc5) TaxID=1213859 RepID=L2FV65_COLFN|nr:Acyl-CoA dehydrogenase family member 10 [Colletotrichum fructicola]KAF4478844.1 Acyl-CoA dehydrogenase family member 10 [Colletotrichum fructicola Nara gc5]KAF4898591.1 Acyl-CoA dehydrogenase family member 10 [Colletotrichum fructicola]